jgi:hypothetical protein
MTCCYPHSRATLAFCVKEVTCLLSEEEVARFAGIMQQVCFEMSLNANSMLQERRSASVCILWKSVAIFWVMKVLELSQCMHVRVCEAYKISL